MQNFYTLRTNPPARPNHFSEDIEGRVKLYIQGTLQHVSTEFLRNHEILTPLTLIIFTFTEIFNMFQHTTEFLGNHQIRTPIKLYIQDPREFF